MVTEIVQVERASEARPSFSPNDKFSNFEILNFGRLLANDRHTGVAGYGPYSGGNAANQARRP